MWPLIVHKLSRRVKVIYWNKWLPGFCLHSNTPSWMMKEWSFTNRTCQRCFLSRRVSAVFMSGGGMTSQLISSVGWFFLHAALTQKLPHELFWRGKQTSLVANKQLSYIWPTCLTFGGSLRFDVFLLRLTQSWQL